VRSANAAVARRAAAHPRDEHRRLVLALAGRVGEHLVDLVAGEPAPQVDVVDRELHQHAPARGAFVPRRHRGVEAREPALHDVDRAQLAAPDRVARLLRLRVPAAVESDHRAHARPRGSVDHAVAVRAERQRLLDEDVLACADRRERDLRVHLRGDADAIASSVGSSTSSR
jgi:hypothetical protein